MVAAGCVPSSECGERWPTTSSRLGEAAGGWPSLTETPHRNVGEASGLQGRELHQGAAMGSSPVPWPDRQGTGKAACASDACSVAALAGLHLDPMGVEARVQGRTMEVEVPTPPRSSQTFQLWPVLILGTTQQPWGDPIRLGSTRTFQPPCLGETHGWEFSCCLCRLAAILDPGLLLPLLPLTFFRH